MMRPFLFIDICAGIARAFNTRAGFFAAGMAAALLLVIIGEQAEQWLLYYFLYVFTP